MWQLLNMATTPEHIELINGFSRVSSDINYQYFIKTNIQEKIVNAWSDNLALLYMGKKNDHFTNRRLIEIPKDNIVTDMYNYVQPDYVLFKDNKFQRINWKIAGSPDLIVEVWSDTNSNVEIEWKKHLYSTGKNTEHWYILQHSNAVECWFEDKRIGTQSLSNVLKTQNNIEFDLRYLAI